MSLDHDLVHPRAVLEPGQPEYEEARAVWNAMVDHHPRAVVVARNVGDVQFAIRHARARGWSVGMRCGGHNVVGHGVPDGGLMIDLRPMGACRVDPRRRRAYVQGGALLRALDEAAQAWGLGTTAGNVSHTGVGGLTLGGGMGWLARRYGLACDNVVSYDLVTATGETLHVTREHHPDLFWALKGGGGNFGVVTQFEFQLHPVAPATLTFEADYPTSQATSVLRQWRDLSHSAPRAATFTADVTGQAVTVGFVLVGDPDDAKPWRDAIARLGTPLELRTTPSTYLQLQTRMDAAHPRATRRYTKNQFISDLTDAAIDTVVDAVREPGAPGAGLQSYGGAIRDVADDATAFSHRDTQFDFTTGFAWTDRRQDERHIAAARRLAAAMAPHTSGVYSNTSGEAGTHTTQRAFAPATARRLAQIKASYDPDNVFRHNANIAPAGPPRTDRDRDHG